MKKLKRFVLGLLITMVSVQIYGQEITYSRFTDTYVGEIKREYLGEFTITHYCSCYLCNGNWTGQPAKNGEQLKPHYTIAVDENVIPLNTRIEIEGYDFTYKACDTGSKIKGNRIDVYVDSHEKCISLGIKKKVKVWKITKTI